MSDPTAPRILGLKGRNNSAQGERSDALGNVPAKFVGPEGAGQ